MTWFFVIPPTLVFFFILGAYAIGTLTRLEPRDIEAHKEQPLWVITAALGTPRDMRIPCHLFHSVAVTDARGLFSRGKGKPLVWIDSLLFWTLYSASWIYHRVRKNEDWAQMALTGIVIRMNRHVSPLSAR